jgi:hypothetical protein
MKRASRDRSKQAFDKNNAINEAARQAKQPLPLPDIEVENRQAFTSITRQLYYGPGAC